MSDMFPDAKPSLGAQVKCVEREITFRKRVYGKAVTKGSMTQESADREIHLMEAVLETLRGLS